MNARSTATLLIGAGILLAPTAQAFDYLDSCGGQPTRWAGNQTTYQLSTSDVSNELAFSTYASQMETSFDEWTRPGCTAYTPTRGSDVNADPDGVSTANIVGFYESGWPAEWGSSTIGITLVSYSPSNCLIGSSDMVFNGQNFTFNPNSNSSNRVDFRSVATHEAGHWAGIGHSNYNGSSLWPSYSGGTAERDLTCDDTEAICGNAPSGATTCSADKYCDCGVSCDGGTCSGTAPVDPTDGTCSGSAVSFTEGEPNDWTGEDDVDYWQPTSGGDVIISGQVSCGNNGSGYTADNDWFVVDLPCTDNARFTLDWTGSSDLDFVVYDTSTDENGENPPFAFNTDGGLSGPSSDDAVAGGRIFAFVACWEGETTNYTFRVDREPFQTTSDPEDPDACGGIDFVGECQGDVAVWCQGGELLERDCSDEGGCDFVEDEGGYWCLGDDGTRDSGEPGRVDTGDPIPLFGECECAAAPTPFTGLLGLLTLGLLPLLRRRSST